MAYSTQAVLDDRWKAGAAQPGLATVTTAGGLPVCRVLGPWAPEIASHIAELHDRNRQGPGCAVEHAYAPGSWYASEPWGFDQTLRRPWTVVPEDHEVKVVADSQFEEELFSGPDPTVIDYLVRLHNFSLLPIR